MYYPHGKKVAIIQILNNSAMIFIDPKIGFKKCH